MRNILPIRNIICILITQIMKKQGLHITGYMLLYRCRVVYKLT